MSIGTLEREHLGWDLAREAAEGNLSFLHSHAFKSLKRAAVGQFVSIIVLAEVT